MRRFPVKSLRGEALEEIAVDSNGLHGDRQRALVVRDGPIRAGKTYRGKEHERLHLIADPDAATAAAAERGVDVSLERDGPFFDDAPVSIIVDRWLDALSAHVGYRVEWQRFRPNFFVHCNARVRLRRAELGRKRATPRRGTDCACARPSGGASSSPITPKAGRATPRFFATSRSSATTRWGFTATSSTPARSGWATS